MLPLQIINKVLQIIDIRRCLYLLFRNSQFIGRSLFCVKHLNTIYYEGRFTSPFTFDNEMQIDVHILSHITDRKWLRGGGGGGGRGECF